MRPGRHAQRLDHYDLLRTLQDMYGLPPLGTSARRTGLPAAALGPAATIGAPPMPF